MNKRLIRSEVDINKTWNAKDLFESREAFELGIEKAKEELHTVVAYKGRLLESAKVLFEGIEALENLSVKLVQLAYYSHLGQAVDATDKEAQEVSMTFGMAIPEIEASLTFFVDEISTLSEEQYVNVFKEDSRLEVYRPYIEEIFEEKKHKLSDETERVLVSLGEVSSSPYTIYSISKAADMQFDTFKDGEGNELENSFALFEGKYEYSEDATVRKNAYDSFNKTLLQYKNTYASTYGTEVKKQVTLSKLRGYESVTDMLLSSQKVTKEMYNRQIDVIYNELAPHMRKFAGLLKEQLGLETLNFYDLKAPLDTSFNPSATYEEVKDITLKALAIMGDEYLDIIKTAFDNRWIDYADNVGKATGAFCASPYGSHPYILVSFQDNMRDAFTLVHELGHAGHFSYANKEQNYFNTRPSLYTIEAPSTMNEMLLGRYLLQENDDPKMKKWVILQFLGTYYHNFVTHLLEAEFQRRIYAMAEQNVPLTSVLLCDTKLDVIRTFWGDSVDIDENAGLTWMRQPHYYMGLYPYTYSAGLTASTAVSEMIFEEGKPAVDRWIEMLKTGGNLKPLELLQVAGMDLSSDAPVQKAVAYVGKLIDQLIELSK